MNKGSPLKPYPEYTDASSLHINESMLPQNIYTPVSDDILTNIPTQYQELDEKNPRIKTHLYLLVEQLMAVIPDLMKLYGYHQKEIIGLVYSFYRLSGNNPEKCFKVSYYFLTLIGEYYTSGAIEKYSLVFCPEIVSIITQRFKMNFYEFFRENLRTLYINYCSRN